jgi:hypothetical protein
MPETHVVKQGETFPSIADRHGFSDWKAIWDAQANAAFRKLRPNPMVLLPGDVVTIPDKKPLEKTPCAAGQEHEVVIHRHPMYLVLELVDIDGEPFPTGTNYTLELGTKNKKVKGSLGANGKLKEKIPPTISKATLTLELEVSKGTKTKIEMLLLIGHLDPADSVTGCQQRLNNMGYTAGKPDGMFGNLTGAALRDFQLANSVKEKGLGELTVKKLIEVHGV